MIYQNVFFLYQDLVATIGVPDLPSAGGATGQKTRKTQKRRKKSLIIHTLIHTFAHTLLSAPGAMSPNRLSAT